MYNLCCDMELCCIKIFPLKSEPPYPLSTLYTSPRTPRSLLTGSCIAGPCLFFVCSFICFCFAVLVLHCTVFGWTNFPTSAPVMLKIRSVLLPVRRFSFKIILLYVSSIHPSYQTEFYLTLSVSPKASKGRG